MDYVDIIIALEDGTLEIKNDDELEQVKNIASEMRYCQGAYGRLYVELENFTKQSDHQKYYPLAL